MKEVVAAMVEKTSSRETPEVSRGESGEGGESMTSSSFFSLLLLSLFSPLLFCHLSPIQSLLFSRFSSLFLHNGNVVNCALLPKSSRGDVQWRMKRERGRREERRGGETVMAEGLGGSRRSLRNSG